MSKEIVGHVEGTIPNPIPKKFLKQLSSRKTTAPVKEDTAGFADASAPSNSNYQSELSPTQTAKKPAGKKKMKSLKEFLRVDEGMTGGVCPLCNNTGMMKKYGNNMLCTNCKSGTDKRVDQENLMFKQARDMLSTGKTTPVAEDTVNELSSKTLHNYIGKRIHAKKPLEGKKRENAIKGVDRAENKIEKREKSDARMREESVVSSVDDVAEILEGYKPSDKLKSRTKYLVQPKLSQMLKDRLVARAADTKTKKGGYTPSKGTLGLAAARRAQMSHAKKKDIEEATDVVERMRKRNEAMRKALGPELKVSKKTDLSSHVKGKELPALSAKPQMGSSNDNRVSEEVMTFNEWNSNNNRGNSGVHAAIDREDKERLEKAKKKPGFYVNEPKKKKVTKEETMLVTEEMSDAAHELVLHADNHAQLHHGSHMPIINNLKRKMKKGTYDSEKAKKLWHYHADRAAQSYHKEYGDKATPWHKMFSTADRKQAAAHWEAHHREELKEEHIQEAKKVVSWNPPEVVARFAKEKKEAKQFASAKKEIDRLKKRNEEVELIADSELKKFTGEGKSGLKRKYLGKMRGRTDTGKPAHAIEIDPVIKTGKRDLSKQVR